MNSKTILATALLLLVVVSLLVERSDGWRRRRRRSSRRRRRCSPVNCVVSAWTSWSTCSANCGAKGSRSRSRSVIRAASCGGSCPYSLTGTRSCDCTYNSPAFGPCSPTCGKKDSQISEKDIFRKDSENPVTLEQLDDTMFEKKDEKKDPEYAIPKWQHLEQSDSNTAEANKEDAMNEWLPPRTSIAEAIDAINMVDGAKGLINGDILAPPLTFEEDEHENENEKRNAIRARRYLWRTRVLPYVLDQTLSKRAKKVIADVIDEYEKKTCIRFRMVKAASREHYIRFFQGKGCYSSVGKRGGNKQDVSIGKRCDRKGIVIHELMHALGFYHEQSRFDRDQYVRIDFSNIKAGKEGNFKRREIEKVTGLGLPYDYDGVMHYGAYAFAVDKNKPTIIKLKKTGGPIGQRKGFSATDLRQLNTLYDCSTDSVKNSWSTWSAYSQCIDLGDGQGMKEHSQRFCFRKDRHLCAGADRHGTQSRSRACASGIKSRTRVLAKPASCGKSCPPRTENNPCISRVCCRKNCGVAAWSAWTACTATCGKTGKQTRARKVLTAASCGGTTCPALRESQNCNRVCCPVNCVVSKWGAWSACSKTCGTRGTKSRTRKIKVAASCGGTCLPLSATQACNRVCCPVNCVHSWNPWSPCDCLGKRKRTLKTTPPKCGGAACPTKTVEKRSCTPIRTCVKGRCDVKTGNCRCFPGFKGTTCNTNCPKGTYGLQCKKKCSCSGRGTCHPSKGYCICPLYYFGSRCQYRYRCGHGYRCYRSRHIAYHRCFLHANVRSTFAACPRTHTPTKCYCRAGCRSVRRRGVCVCMCRRTNPTAVCCPRARYLG